MLIGPPREGEGTKIVTDSEILAQSSQISEVGAVVLAWEDGSESIDDRSADTPIDTLE